jgi:TonB-linked SusC/RagA family outer membrane protein
MKISFTPCRLKYILCITAIFSFVIASGQSAITGKVISSENNDAIPGASINIKGSSLGTLAASDGSFALTANNGQVLVVSYVGYQSREIAVKDGASYIITLENNNSSLSEVVVTGYGTERKKDITGSVSIVDVKALRAIPAGSAVLALQGQAPGVNIISSGSPGAESSIFVRGVSSFGSTQPLVIIDGVQSDLSNVNASDIESMQVLKDAGAAAIYGVRGANGVIVVTTKKGKSGQPSFSYDSYFGMQLPLPGNPFNFLNSENFARLYKVAYPGTVLFANGLPDYMYRGPGVTGIASEGDSAVDPSKYIFDPSNSSKNYLIQKVNKQGTNWFQEVFDPAPITSHNITANGATDKAAYLVSLNYFNQQGTLSNTYLKRYSMRINTSFKIRDNIRIGENVYLFYRQNPSYGNLVENTAIPSVIRIMPVIPVYDIKGNYGGTFGGPELGDAENPVAQQLRNSNNRDNSWNMIGNIYGEVDFFKHFTVRSSIGGTINNRYNVSFSFVKYNNSVGSNSPNSLSEASGYNSNIIWTNTLKYANTFGKHIVSAIIGSEAIENYGRRVSGSSSALYSTNFDYQLLGNGTTSITNASTAFQNNLYSLFGRADYSYNSKYLVGVTVRRDGSSVFGKEKRYGIFPSVSLGWRMSDESFMKNLSWLNDLKLRASYGILGSQSNVNPTNAFTLFGSAPGTSYYGINGGINSTTQGFAQTFNGNSATGWEENVVTNVGFDATLLHNHVNFSVEYYKKSINGLLFSQPLPASAGGAAPPVINIGDIQNTGMDIAAGYRGLAGHDFGFTVSANITTYKNLVKDIPGPGYFDAATSRIGTLVRNQKGEPVSSFFGYEVIGLFQSADDVSKSPAQADAQEGRFKYRDVNGDGVITTDDRTFFGNPNPKFTYGLNIGFTYKAFDLSTIFYGVQGNHLLNHQRWWTEFFSTFTGAKSNALLNAWTPGNTTTNVPKIETSSNISTSGAPNSYYMENGSYLRLRSLIVGYTFNPGRLKRTGIQKLRIYAQGANLFTITKYTGLDPELGGQSSNFGIDFGNYPNNQKNFLVGLNLSF